MLLRRIAALSIFIVSTSYASSPGTEIDPVCAELLQQAARNLRAHAADVHPLLFGHPNHNQIHLNRLTTAQLPTNRPEGRVVSKADIPRNLVHLSRKQVEQIIDAVEAVGGEVILAEDQTPSIGISPEGKVFWVLTLDTSIEAVVHENDHLEAFAEIAAIVADGAVPDEEAWLTTRAIIRTPLAAIFLESRAVAVGLEQGMTGLRNTNAQAIIELSNYAFINALREAKHLLQIARSFVDPDAEVQRFQLALERALQRDMGVAMDQMIRNTWALRRRAAAGYQTQLASFPNTLLQTQLADVSHGASYTHEASFDSFVATFPMPRRYFHLASHYRSAPDSIRDLVGSEIVVYGVDLDAWEDFYQERLSILLESGALQE